MWQSVADTKKGRGRGFQAALRLVPGRNKVFDPGHDAESASVPATENAMTDPATQRKPLVISESVFYSGIAGQYQLPQSQQHLTPIR
jgi:hypothetical protein